jgi:HlyD family secretion protein
MVALMALVGCNGNRDLAGGSGFIETDEVTVSAEAAGRITSLLIVEGSSVKMNDTIAVIDSSRLHIELSSTKASRATSVANLETAKLQAEKARSSEKFAISEKDRIARLLRTGSATQKQMDQAEYEATQATIVRQTAEANIKVIEAQILKIDSDIDRIKRSLLDCCLLSPSKGIVTEKFVDAGEVVTVGKAVARISNLDTVWVKVYLPAAEFAACKIGDKASVVSEGQTTKYSGSVIWTSAEAEFTPKNVQTEKSRSNLVYAVKVSIANSDGRLKIGMPVYVTLEK